MNQLGTHLLVASMVPIRACKKDEHVSINISRDYTHHEPKLTPYMGFGSANPRERATETSTKTTVVIMGSMVKE